MDKELKFIKEVAVKAADLGGRVYYVGGYVRDKLLNKDNKDIDVEVYGLSILELKSILEQYGEVLSVGESFGILMVKGFDIDFSLPRTESKTGLKHTDFEVNVDANLSVKEATKRRDFTINSILQDVITLEYIDYYNGIEDIKSGIIRYINKDTFIEDELRVFRACQFASRFNFKIDDSIKDVIQGFDYQSLSKERIYEELNKALLKSDKPSIAFNYLLELGVIKKLYPELYSLVDCIQDKINHPEGSVWNHTMLVLDEAASLKDKSKNPLYFMYSALCHDLGKPSTINHTNGKITFYNHDKVGVWISDKFMRKLTNETKLINYVKTLTEYHMKGHKVLEFKDKTLSKLMVTVDINELLLLTQADELGRGNVKGKDREEFDKKLVKYKDRISQLSNGEFGKIEPYFKGEDLLKLGYTQGKELGQTLKEAYYKQISGVSREDILSFIKGKLKPKKRSLEDVAELEFYKLLGEDKSHIKKVKPRLQLFREVYKQNNSKGFKTTKEGLPYYELINKKENIKYLITPYYIKKMELDNKVIEDVLNVFNMTIYERLVNFNKFKEGKEVNLNNLTKVYGRLPKLKR